MAAVDLIGVSKRFGEVVAPEPTDLAVAAGEFAALLGPSGCGKSTTLFLLAGIYEPSEGEIRCDGARINEVEARDRNVGIVFQSYALYPHMTVARNIGFPLRLKGVPEAEARRRIEAIARLVRVEDLLGRRPAEMSGGQQQRVALGRLRQRAEDGTLLADPPLFLDELAAAVRRAPALPAGLVQLDVKEPLERLDRGLLEGFACALEGIAPAFTAGGCEAGLIEALAVAAPGIARGFDPLLAYAAAGLPTDAAGFRALGEAAFAAMPDAAIFYLEARLFLAAARVGVCLPAIVKRGGALVDAWTVDADRPDLLGPLEELARLGCGQVTSNDPLALRALWEGTA